MYIIKEKVFSYLALYIKWFVVVISIHFLFGSLFPKETNTITKEIVVMKDIEQADVFMAECTGYTAGYESTGKYPYSDGYGITSSGKMVRKGYVAADINKLPYGSLIYLENMGIFEVQDTGGMINDNCIDIYFDDVNEAINFGRKEIRAIVLRKGYFFMPK